MRIKIYWYFIPHNADRTQGYCEKKFNVIKNNSVGATNWFLITTMKFKVSSELILISELAKLETVNFCILLLKSFLNSFIIAFTFVTLLVFHIYNEKNASKEHKEENYSYFYIPSSSSSSISSSLFSSSEEEASSSESDDSDSDPRSMISRNSLTVIFFGTI